MKTYHGGCHCGALGFEFSTALEPSAWSIRACQCNFCRAHAGVYTSFQNAVVYIPQTAVNPTPAMPPDFIASFRATPRALRCAPTWRC